MNEVIERISKFHKTTKGYLAFGTAELALLYIFASISIDTANMWAYLASLTLAIGAIVNFAQVLKRTSPLKKNAGRKH